MPSTAHPKVDLSEQDRELISLLQWAPRITWGEAAEILDAHPTTLAGRWERLRSSGVAWLTAQINLSDRANLLAFTEVTCDPGARHRVVGEFVAMPEVLSIEAFAPAPDLGLTILGHDLQSLSRLLEDRICRVAGVAGIRTMISSRLHRAGDGWRLDHLTQRQREAARAWERADRGSLPAATSPLGEEHRPVVEALMRDGRASAAEIARSTGLHAATARRHLHKVLASGALSIRCDLVQSVAGSPVTAQWFMRLPAGRHAAAAEALGRDPRTRVVASTTGRSNFLVVMWLGSVGELLEAERTIESLVTGAEIQHSLVTLRPIKRMGWVLHGEGYAGTEFVAPQPYLG